MLKVLVLNHVLLVSMVMGLVSCGVDKDNRRSFVEGEAPNQEEMTLEETSQNVEEDKLVEMASKDDAAPGFSAPSQDEAAEGSSLELIQGGWGPNNRACVIHMYFPIGDKWVPAFGCPKQAGTKFGNTTIHSALLYDQMIVNKWVGFYDNMKGYASQMVCSFRARDWANFCFNRNDILAHATYFMTSPKGMKRLSNQYYLKSNNSFSAVTP